MTKSYILGAGSTIFSKHQTVSFRDLTEQAIHDTLKDAAFSTVPEEIFFGNCAMGSWGQSNIKGQVALQGAVENKIIPNGLPIHNIEGGCATGSLTFGNALRAVQSGACSTALAVGVEKLLFPDDPKMLKSFPIFSSGIDQIHKNEWKEHQEEQAKIHNLPFNPHPYRVIFLDVHALKANAAIKEGWLTEKALTQIAAQNHNQGAKNPLAQYRFNMSAEQVAQDRPIVAPFTRSMCSPVSDGAAAVLICSEAHLKTLPSSVASRAVEIRAFEIAGGKMRGLNEPSVAERAAEKLYAKHDIRPENIDLAEVHDSTAYCQAHAITALNLCSKSDFTRHLDNGTFSQEGTCPVNLSGGLISKGHPLGATGLGQIFELCLQLRQEAKEHQATKKIKTALAQNGGGMIGLDEALCAITVLSSH